jgi:hypothetical protein
MQKCYIFPLRVGGCETAYLTMDGGKIGSLFGKVANDIILDLIYHRDFDAIICEEIQCFGMAVGKSTLDTVRWTGRCEEAAHRRGIPFYLVGRKEVVLHWCQSARARDPNVRRALLDHYGEPGTKNKPGQTYGITKDVWSALAIAGYWMNARYSA